MDVYLDCHVVDIFFSILLSQSQTEFGLTFFFIAYPTLGLFQNKKDIHSINWRRIRISQFLHFVHATDYREEFSPQIVFTSFSKNEKWQNLFNQEEKRVEACLSLVTSLLIA